MSWKKWRQRTRACLVLILGLPLLLILLLLIYRGYSQMTLRSETKIVSADGIESLEQIALGGVEQWTLIRGEDITKPILLWLHGGPGSTTMPLAAQHDDELIKDFVVVHWDQRGAGKSFASDLPKSSMTVEQFVADAIALTEQLVERFDAEKVYLIGHSWGTTIGTLAIHERPELFHAYVGVAQSVSPDGDAIAYEWAMEQAAAQGNDSAQSALTRIGPPPWDTLQDFGVLGTQISNLGGTGRNYTIIDYLRESALSPDYSLRDVLRYQQAQIFSLTTMLENGQLGTVDLFEQVGEIDVPVYFFQGRYDYNTPGELVERYHEQIDAPEKSLVWFEESAHFPHLEEPEKFVAELRKILQ